MAEKKLVYSFGGNRADGDASMKALLGGKGANLAEMVNLGMPVPPGFTISTEVCTYYYTNNNKYPTQLQKQIKDALKLLEQRMGKKFGDPKNPLLVSVRSGARASMPGMMDTVLNLGLNDVTVQGLVAKSGNSRFAYDSYRRFVAMYGDVVLGLKPQTKTDIDPFEEILDHKKHAHAVANGIDPKSVMDTDLTTDELIELVAEFKAAIKDRLDLDFPEDPLEQLYGAIGAVFGSWMNERAIIYRRQNKIPDEWGTAVNIQAMVFGNMGLDCATGVGFTRDSGSGESLFNGEYLINAQGEDVVAGIRTPQQITLVHSQRWAESHGIPEADRAAKFPSLEEAMPESYKQLVKISNNLEKHYRDMMDIEFTIENKTLFMLQCRVGKRTGFAALRIATDLANEKKISKREAVMRVEPDQLNQLLRPVFDRKAKDVAISQGKKLAMGLPAGPGAATGQIVFFATDAEEWANEGKTVLLCRLETTPEDIRGMTAAKGILTARGGMTSHAALVARQMGKVCVAGCGEIEIDYVNGIMSFGDKKFNKGDWLSIDGFTGEVIEGKIDTRPSELIEVLIDKTMKPADSELFQRYDNLMKWADAERKLGIRTNADQPDQAATAIAFGAQGIGLCRTEHMFFGGQKILAMREMILADTLEDRKNALAKLLPLQRDDFAGIFRAMQGYPVTIRTLDPPLHEFVPHEENAQEELSQEPGIPVATIQARVEELREANPMLGHRGCRLGMSYPEITEMQARAVFEAACIVHKEGIPVHPEVMIPLVSTVKELEEQANIVRRCASEVFAEYGFKVPYLVGTMIELPRAALTADEIASVAEFFSFGTNDLTQTTYGLSRDDAGRFLPFYIEKKIYPSDPFAALDRKGVGKLVKMATELGRGARETLKLSRLKVGICGEHGGEPSSVEFCHLIGLDYVSCSPFRVPIARLAAAQAAIANAPAPTVKPVVKAKPVAKKAKAVKAPAKKTTAAKAPAKKTATAKAPAKKAAVKAKPVAKKVAAKKVVKPVAKKAVVKKAAAKKAVAKKVVAKKPVTKKAAPAKAKPAKRK
ncbi:MAG: pyruvate, phosphate dikinase [bacterium]|nr:pyruvate, phosphate dikinase [bacterium]